MHIVVLGAGVMGSALCVPAAASTPQQKTKSVTLVGSPLDEAIIESINASRHHPTLDVHLPEAITAISHKQCDATLLQSADLIILGVSSAGIGWAIEQIRSAQATPKLLSLVTKGLMENPVPSLPPLTYAHTLPNELNMDANKVVGIGGPCIARELALNIPTRVIFGSKDIQSCDVMRSAFQTDTYRIKTTTDIEQLEACAALKNFLCIGVSAMLGAHPLNDSHAKNPVAALFNQAVLELRVLSEWIAPSPQSTQPDITAFDLAGLGDLHVTVGGGRNSRLGNYLGQGHTLDSVLNNQMLNVTVEGVDTGKQLHSGVVSACETGTLNGDHIPLTLAILQCIHSRGAFEFDFTRLPG